MATATVEVELPQCPVLSVVVYPGRAEVTRVVQRNLDAGEHDIQLKKVSKAIVKDSVRVDGVGSASIVEVSFQEVPVTQQQDNQDEIKDEVAKLEKDIADTEQKKIAIANEKCRIEAQLSLLQDYSSNLTSSSATGHRSTLAEAETYGSFFDFLDTYDQNFVDLSKRINELDEENTELCKIQDEAKNTLTSVKPKLKKNSDEPIKQPTLGVLLAVKEKGPVKLLVSYLVTNATWTPKYDLRVCSQERTMEVGYFGMVEQSTGEDWNEAKLSLSTASPSIGGNAPELETCKVNLIHFENQRSKEDFYVRQSNRLHQDYDRLRPMSTEAVRGGTFSGEKAVIPQSKVTEGLSSSVFEILAPATIPSHGSAHKVSIASIKLKPSFEYETVPKLSQHAFLKAKVKNESRYSMLAGPANVFLDQAFVTKSSLPDVSPMEEFNCSLGSDPSVKVVYKPINKYREESGLISVSVLFTYRQVTEITNTRKEPATILFTDQIPLSKDDKLKVTLLEPQIAKIKPGQSPPNPNLTAQNHVTWILELMPEETKQVTVRYTVEYPKNKRIEGL